MKLFQNYITVEFGDILGVFDFLEKSFISGKPFVHQNRLFMNNSIFGLLRKTIV